MPPEFALRKRERARRRGLAAVVAGVLVLVVGGVGALYWWAADVQQQLDGERAVTQALLDAQLEYSDVTSLQARLDDIVAQRDVLTATEIRWRDALLPFLAVFGPGDTVDAIIVRGNAPFEPPLTLDGPLRSPRSSTAQLTVATSGIPETSSWMESWRDLEGFADASIDSIAQEGEEGFVTIVTVNFTDDVLAEQEVAE